MAQKTIVFAIISISVLVSFGLTSNQAFAGFNQVVNGPTTCEECFEQYRQCDPVTSSQTCKEQLLDCFRINELQCTSAVGGGMIQMETTSVLAAGAQNTAA